MKSINQNFKELRMLFFQTNIVWYFIYIFEIVIVTVLGILSNKFQKVDFKSESFLLLVIFIILYILIKLFFIFAMRPLKTSLVDEIEAKYELNNMNIRIHTK